MSVSADPSEQKLQTLILRAQGEGANAISAFEEIYHHFARNILAFVTTRRRGKLDPEDLASETWLKVHRSLHQFQSGNFKAWLFSVARSVVFDDGRRQSVRPEELPLDDRDAPVADIPLEDARIEYLRECLEELESDFVLTLRMKIELHSTADIAQRTGVSEGTVYTRVLRGKEMLEDCVRRKES